MKAGEWVNLAGRATRNGGNGKIGNFSVCLLVTITTTATNAEANSKNLNTTSAKAKQSVDGEAAGVFTSGGYSTFLCSAAMASCGGTTTVSASRTSVSLEAMEIWLNSNSVWNLLI